MKATHKVRPVLVETKEPANIIGWKNKVQLTNDNISQLVDKYYQLILISLEDEKIEVGELCYHKGSKEVVNYQNGGFPKGHCFKVIATQSQLSPELIQQLVYEYNNGGMKDFEIEFDNIRIGTEDISGMGIYDYKPKLTNGFVTVVGKEPILYTEKEVWNLFKEYRQWLYKGPEVRLSKNKLDIWFEQNRKKH